MNSTAVDDVREIFDALFTAKAASEVYIELPAPLRRIHLYVLAALQDLDGRARVGDLAARAQMQVPNLAKLTRELDEMGHVRKRASRTDRRVVEVELTESGRAVLERYYHRFVKALATELDLAGRPELRTLAPLLRDVLERFEQVAAALDRENAQLVPPPRSATESHSG